MGNWFSSNDSGNRPENEQPTKIVTLGETCIGMSSLIHRFVEQRFPETRWTTIGVDFQTRNIVLDDVGNSARVQIWDIAGQERYRSIVPLYVDHGRCDAVVVGYDITNADSFRVAEQWIRYLESENFLSSTPLTADPPFVMLVGCKSDLEHSRAISAARVSAFADEHRIPHMLASAMTGHNVTEVFQTAAVGARSKRPRAA